MIFLTPLQSETSATGSALLCMKTKMFHHTMLMIPFLIIEPFPVSSISKMSPLFNIPAPLKILRLRGLQL